MTGGPERETHTTKSMNDNSLSCDRPRKIIPSIVQDAFQPTHLISCTALMCINYYILAYEVGTN